MNFWGLTAIECCKVMQMRLLYASTRTEKNMASVIEDWRGVVIELDHNETDNLLKTLLQASGGAAGVGGSVTALLVAIGVSAAAVPIVVAALVAHLAWEIPVIKAMDQGQGVILTMPWIAPGLMIPATRHATDINQNWVAAGSGTFVSGGGDRVDYKVEHNAGDPKNVFFRLINTCQSGWDKGVTLRDGQGSSWLIKATKSHQGENSLWANQVRNGQVLTFAKPGFAGIWLNVFNVGGMAPLQPGDRATFTWTRD